MGVVIYFVRDAAMTSMVLDFVKLCESHTGKYLSKSLVGCLREYGIDKKILGVVCDNASNNDTLVSELELELGGQNGRRTRIRCFAHILNLAVKAILTPFSRAFTEVEDDADMDNEIYDIEDEEEEEEEDEVENGREESDAVVVGEIEGEVNLEIAVTSAQLGVVKSALTKVSSL